MRDDMRHTQTPVRQEFGDRRRRLMASHPATGGHAAAVVAALSERENEILALMAQGRSNLGIAERLVVSDRTIESHVRSIMRKLGVPEGPDDHRRVLAVLAYLDARSSGLTEVATVQLPGRLSIAR